MPGTDFDIANAAYILVRSIFCLNLFIPITLSFQPSHLGKDASRSFLCRCFFVGGGGQDGQKKHPKTAGHQLRHLATLWRTCKREVSTVPNGSFATHWTYCKSVSLGKL